MDKFNISRRKLSQRVYPVREAGGESTPVILPSTEAGADANTFVCEMTGGASANETGVGLGLAGANLVLTQSGGVAAASAGFRVIDAVSKGFTCTQTLIETMFNGNEWTFMRNTKNTTPTYTTRSWRISAAGSGQTQLIWNSASQSTLLCDDDNGLGSVNYGISPISTDGWLALWYKSGALCMGFGCASIPTRYEDFDIDKRFSFNGQDIDMASSIFSGSLDLVGNPSNSTSITHDIGTIVMSNTALGIPNNFLNVV